MDKRDRFLASVILVLTATAFFCGGRTYQYLHDKAVILAAQQDADQAAGLEDYCKSLLREQEDQ